jgi:hypothetical protein
VLHSQVKGIRALRAVRDLNDPRRGLGVATCLPPPWVRSLAPSTRVDRCRVSVMGIGSTTDAEVP